MKTADASLPTNTQKLTARVSVTMSDLPTKPPDQAVEDALEDHFLNDVLDPPSSPLSSVPSDFEARFYSDFPYPASYVPSRTGVLKAKRKESISQPSNHRSPLKEEHWSTVGDVIIVQSATSVQPSRDRGIPDLEENREPDQVTSPVTSPQKRRLSVVSHEGAGTAGDQAGEEEITLQSPAPPKRICIGNNSSDASPLPPASTVEPDLTSVDPLTISLAEPLLDLTERSPSPGRGSRKPSKRLRIEHDNFDASPLPSASKIEPDTASVEPSTITVAEPLLDLTEISPLPGQSARKRAPIKRYDDEVESPSSSTKKPSPGKAPNRTSRKGAWSSTYLLQNPKSKLANANLLGVLSDPRAWTLLSKVEQMHLLSMLPEPVVTESPNREQPPNILQKYLKNNTAFQADVRLLQEDLYAGRYNPKWLADAKAAMQKRAEGKFDGWKEQQREAFWGQKQKLHYKVLAGDSTSCKLSTLLEADCFRVGDIWSYSRSFGREKAKSIKVEKEAKITKILANKRLCCTFAPGQHKFSSPAHGDDVVLDDISGPQQLAMAILKEDGRITDPPNGNAWKEFRCWRNNQDIGSIWEIREAYYLRSNGVI